MFKRSEIKKFAAAVVLAAATFASIGVVATAVPAGATGPSSGSEISGLAAPQAGFASNAPFSSGQKIDIVVPANSIFASTNNLNVLECAAPDGVLPTDDSTCDGSTINGLTFKPIGDGSADYHTYTHTGYYTIYALPDFASLGEYSGPAECDLTTECVLYVGTEQNNFASPHYFSTPFFVNPNAGVDSGVNPGDGSALSTGLTLTKSTTTASLTSVGQVIPYTYLVTNTGNTSITGVSVADNKILSVSCPSDTLAAGASETCTASYTVTSSDMLSGLTNIATASALDPDSNVLTSPPSQVSLSFSPPDGSTLPGATAATGTITSGTPFSSGQSVNVVVPPNIDLTQHADINILECSAPNGVIPSNPAACDGNTIQSSTVRPQTNGSLDLHAQSGKYYKLYALPDLGALGETPSGPACDLATACVLYIGDNQNDFSAPHYWSAPFYINPNGGSDSGANPGDGTCTAAPFISSADSATAVARTAFTFNVTSCSATAPAFKAGEFPKGITLTDHHDGTATLAGTITAFSGIDSSAVITATVHGEPVNTQHFTMKVESAPTFTDKNVALVHTGTAFDFPITTVSGYPEPTITTSSPLPAGVTLTDNGDGTAALAGTPGSTSGGIYPLTLVATNGIGAPVNQSFTLTVEQASTLVVPSVVTVTEGVAITPITVDYAGFPTPALKASGLPKGLTMVDNLDGTATISGTPLPKVNGIYTSTILTKSKGGNTTATITFTVNSLAVYTSKAPATAHTGTAITPYLVTTAYGYPTPTITTSSPLPAGITLTDNGDGTATLSGTPGPTAGGSYPITIDATNSTGTATNSFTWIVEQAAVITSADSDTVTHGVPMTPFTVTSTAYPLDSLKAGGLPKGVTLVDNHDGTGTISGTPTTAGTYTATIIASSKGGGSTQTFTVTVS